MPQAAYQGGPMSSGGFWDVFNNVAIRSAREVLVISHVISVRAVNLRAYILRTT